MSHVPSQRCKLYLADRYFIFSGSVVDMLPGSVVRIGKSIGFIPMITAYQNAEAARLRYPHGNPTRLQWHVLWPLEDLRNELLWHAANAGVPATLCQELRWLRQDWAKIRRCGRSGLLQQLWTLENLSIGSMELDRVNA